MSNKIINDLARVNASKSLCWMPLTHCVPNEGLKAVVRVANSIDQLHDSIARQFQGGFYINHRVGFND